MQQKKDMVATNYRTSQEYSFNTFANNLPPCNTDAEEAILGGILLDEAAITRIPDLKPEMFYVQAHAVIYDCCLSLHQSGHPTDLMSVASWLSDHELLEKIGGTSKLAQLVNSTVSAVNIDRYARIVIDKFQRREIIRAGNEIVEMGYRSYQELSCIQERIGDILAKTPSTSDSDSFKKDYEKLISEIEKIIKGEINPGIRFLKLNKLAFKYKKEYGLGAKGLEDLYFRDLVNRDFEPFLGWKDLKAKYEDEQQNWLMRGIIPAGATILCHAPGGTGKTRFFYRMMQRLAERIDHDYFSLGDPVEKVAIIQTDESAAQSISTLSHQGMVTDNLIFKTKWTIEQIPQLRKEIEEMEVKPKLMLIDNLSTVSRYSIFSENDMEYARPILLLNEIARDFNITIVLVHHSNALGNSRGTTAIINSVDLELKISKDPQDQSGEYRLLTIGKTRMRRPAQYKFLVDWEVNEWNFVEEMGEEANSFTASTKDTLLRFLKKNRGTIYECEELAAATGSSLGNVRKVAGLLAADGLIQKKRLARFNKNGYCLPDHNVPVNRDCHSADRSSMSMDQLTAELPTALRESDSSIPDPCASKSENFSECDNEKKSTFDGSWIRDGYSPDGESILAVDPSVDPCDHMDQLSEELVEEITQRLLDPNLTHEQYIKMWEDDVDNTGLAVSRLSEQYQERLKKLAEQPEIVIPEPTPTKDLSLLEVGDRITRGNQIVEITKIYPRRLYRKYEVLSLALGKKQEMSLSELQELGYKVCRPIPLSNQLEII